MATDPMFYWYKRNRCAHCGLTIQEILEQFGKFNRIFQFHHIDPSKKSPDYENLIRRKISTEQLDELDKCALLCDRCHNALHAQNIDVTTVITIKAEGREFIHELKCQVLIDKKHQRVMYFTDQLSDIFLYWVMLGEDEPKLYCGSELTADDTLMKMVHKTKVISPLVVWSFRGDFMAGAIKTGDDEYELTVDPRFPLFTADLNFSTADSKSPQTLSFFIRNGALLTNLGHGTNSQISVRMKANYDNKGAPRNKCSGLGPESSKLANYSTFSAEALLAFR